MASNSFGKQFVITTFGESHGKFIGVVIDGCPAGLKVDEHKIQMELNRRRPGFQVVASARKEDDHFEITSGLAEGITTGAPICILIQNKDANPADYETLKEIYRPSHADFVYEKKYGIRNISGGGRSSARETACRVIAGAIAKQILSFNKIEINAFVNQVGNIRLEKNYQQLDFSKIELSGVRCPDESVSEKMLHLISEVKNEGDTIGGMICCVIKNCPVGLGDPVYEKLEANFAKAMLSINAVKGFEFGSGFESASKRGSEINDEFVLVENEIKTKTNFSGGIQGGISNGMDIYFNVAFKPVSTILKNQSTINKKLIEVEYKPTGRHDVCVVPRAVPIVEAMAALVLVDHLLLNRLAKI